MDVTSAAFFVRAFGALAKGTPLAQESAKLPRLATYRRFLALTRAEGPSPGKEHAAVAVGEAADDAAAATSLRRPRRRGSRLQSAVEKSWKTQTM